ncbi:MAG: cytochrome c biogenesis protein ResB [Acidobacteria bacterium]|nr:cytochrome c biogenesis protein ResB [Acidobacteriota bacterium]
MSALEETKADIRVQPAPARAARAGASPVTRLLNLLSSVRFGVTMLMLLVVLSMIGMLVMQKQVDGFDKYFADLTPATRLLFGRLGWFDIYNAWYFNLLLLVLSLNIVLASIDRFPGAFAYVRRPKVNAGRTWLKTQEVHDSFVLAARSREEALGRIGAAYKSAGLRNPRVTERPGGAAVVFAQRNTWNRLGAYAVHVALLTIFLGGFLTNMFEHNGQMPLSPGDTSAQISETEFNLDERGLQLGKSSLGLPFEVTCTDIQQKLIRLDGPITADNTIDWLTHIKIKDETGEHTAVVHMNNPHDYRGYRFFQASFINLGRARQISLRATPEAGGQPVEVTIARDGSAALPDGTRIDLLGFQPDFVMSGGQITTATGEYNNPAAQLLVRAPDGKQERAFAFAQELPDGAPIGRAVGGYKFRLASFEKVAEAHVLSVQKDPGATVFYVGSGLLCLTLSLVFFFSHQRFWTLVEPREGGDGFEVTMGASVNRNQVALEDRCKRLKSAITGEPIEVES